LHLQANADVRHGLEHPTRDLEQNIIATSRVLEAMRATGTSKILFASTGSIYGEPRLFPTPEDAPFPIQTSLYGASKLAAEGLLAAYCHGYGLTGVICRFVSILGERYTHGHVYDFYCALRRDASRLRVLGNGRQEKSYLYVQDCVSALLLAMDHHDHDAGTVNVYNLGTDETLTVDESVAIISAHLGVRPLIEHTGGIRGWIGDSPRIRLDTRRIRSLGWQPTTSIRDAVIRTLEWLDANEFVRSSSVPSHPGHP
jgi:UDP-glucose 4-epimerase